MKGKKSLREELLTAGMLIAVLWFGIEVFGPYAWDDDYRLYRPRRLRFAELPYEQWDRPYTLDEIMPGPPLCCRILGSWCILHFVFLLLMAFLFGGDD